MKLRDAVLLARESGDYSGIVPQIPYADFLGIRFSLEGDGLIGHLPFAEHLIGNGRVGALHGGAIGALLEFTGTFNALHRSSGLTIPKTISLTIEYIRQANFEDTFCRAEIVRQGRRVTNLRVMAYQSDASKLVAAANAHFLTELVEDREEISG